MDSTVKISVVIMAFNEENSLEIFVRELYSILKSLNYPSEVLIVNDGSSDRTGEIAKNLSEELAGLRIIHHDVNRGLGTVYRTGFVNAKGEFITFFPADGQFPAAIIEQFIPVMDNADMVLGYVPKRLSSLFAMALSKGEKIVYGLLFGPLPKFQGIFMVRRKLLDEIEPRSTGRGWTIIMELIIRASRDGYKLVSVPTEMRPRAGGRSKVNNLPNIWANLKQLFILWSHI